MSYFGFGVIYNPSSLAYSARMFDAQAGSSWRDGGGDTFDGWNGFRLTINGSTSAIVSSTEMNDSSGAITTKTMTIGGQEVTVYSKWLDRDFFLIQCRYGGASGVLSFYGGVGSDGGGVETISGLIGSSGGTPDPRIYWAVVPLLSDELNTTVVSTSGKDPLTVNVTAMTGGFALLFSWAYAAHMDIYNCLVDLRAEYQTSEIHWPSYAAPQHTVKAIGDTKLHWANNETREQAWPGENSIKETPAQSPEKICPITSVSALSAPPSRKDFGFISGIVTRKSVPAAGKHVICLDERFNLVAETISAGNGYYRFDNLLINKLYTIHAYDNEIYQYAPVGADRRMPEAYP